MNNLVWLEVSLGEGRFFEHHPFVQSLYSDHFSYKDTYKGNHYVLVFQENWWNRNIAELTQTHSQLTQLTHTVNTINAQRVNIPPQIPPLR